MNSWGGFLNPQGSGRQPSKPRRFYPVAGSFSDAPPNGARHEASNIQQPQPGHFSTTQYVSPQQIFPSPHTPFPSVPYQQPQDPFSSGPYQDPLNRTFATSGPVVHEGFIPAPGQEDEDEAYPALPDEYRDSLFYNRGLQSSSDDDSEEERALAAEEERILREAAERNDREEDRDWSMSEGEIEDDPEEMIIEEEFDDEDEPVPKRGKANNRGTRGGRRGRPPRGARGGARSAPSRRGRKPRPPGKPKGKRGPRATADPGPQFRDLQRLANEAYMRKDFSLAIEYAEKAIQLNPEIFAAHNILSEIYAAMGQEQKSIQALIVGGPTKRDKELWWHVIERVENIDSKKYPYYTEKRKRETVLNCLKSIIALDSSDYEARGRKLEMDAKLGLISRCVKQCRKMLSIRPHDYDVLRQMAHLGTSSAKQTKLHLARIVSCFEFSITYFLAHDDDPSTSNLDWALLNIYLDLLDLAGDYDRALSRLKTLSRWKQNRREETFWDYQEDDREFDLEDAPRRVAVPEFSRTSRKTKYGKTLPMEIRVKMGLFRLRQQPQNFSEAMHHLEMLEPEDESPDALLWDYPDVFRQVADTLHLTGHDDVALRFYEPLYKHIREQLSLRSFLGLHTCYTNLDLKDKADEVLQILKAWEAHNVHGLTILAKFFEDVGLKKLAMDRGEAACRNNGTYWLRKIGFKGYDELMHRFITYRNRARGKHSARKARISKYMKKIKVATQDDVDSEDEDGTNERPSLGPLGERPGEGLFRTRQRQSVGRPRTFLPVEGESTEPEPETFEGTNVPVTAFDHNLFRRKLEKLAIDCADDLKAARAQHRAVVASFKRLNELRDDADDGDQAASSEYLSVARELIEEFLTFDLFYASKREDFKGYFRRIGGGEFWKDSALMALAVEANRVEDGEKEPDIRVKEKPDTIPQEFYGVHFDEWVDTFARYAMLLARRGENDRCFSALDAAVQSNIIYRSQGYHDQLELCRLACALAVDDSKQASASVRYLLHEHPFGSELFRLYSSVNRLCSIPQGFATDAVLKRMLRYIKTMDYVLLTPEQRIWYNFKGDEKSQWMIKAISSDLVKYVKDHDPALFALYAHVLMCCGSYIAALNYYFRAFAIAPEDPALNLSIGIAYIQHALKRGSENRQYQIQQGLSFIHRYYELRTKNGVAIHCSEAEFNVGRVWHMLGLMPQALVSYERCLALSERVQREAKDRCSDEDGGVEDFATEAAYAMQTIYALSGDLVSARKVTEAALVIE